MFSLKAIIRSDYDEFIRTDLSVPAELREALKSHERVPAFVDNMVVEIEKAENYLLRKGKQIDRMKIKLLVYELTKQFVHLFKVKAQEHHMSQLAAEAKRASIEGDELTKKFDDQGNADFTEELGVEIVDNNQRSILGD